MTLDEAYDLYRSVRDDGQPTVECIEKLYPLVRERVTRVIGKVLRRTPPEELIVTCTTDVLMDLDQYVPDQTLSTWIETVTRHVCYRENGRKKLPAVAAEAKPDSLSRYESTLQAIPGYTAADQFQGYAFDKQLDGSMPDDRPAIAPDPSMTELYDKISSLPLDERELIDMLLEGFTHKEISEKWGLPLGTVDRKIHEIQKKLR